jgi:hypothetical protein
MQNDDLVAFFDNAKMLNILKESKDNKFSGSPYLSEEFQPGNITLTDGHEYNNILLRYNIFQDQFEFTKEDTDYTLVKHPEIYLINLGERVFVFREFEYKDSKDSGYLEQLIDGKYSLYYKHKILLRAIEDVGGFSEESKPTFWHQKPLIMMGVEDKGVVEIKGTKDLYNKFPVLRDKLDAYKGKKKIKLKSVEDYMELVDYLNSI